MALGLKRVLPIAALAAAGLVVAGCAPSSYAGITLAAGAADPDLQALTRRAQGGDKRAQLQLGIRYEDGRGVPANPRRAEWLYRQAARSGTGKIYVYVPGTGRAGGGGVLAVPSAPDADTAQEAHRRLRALLARSRQNS
ncbi:MAG: SEL1-like repeat protein [Allosphingosinicella sp.]